MNAEEIFGYTVLRYMKSQDTEQLPVLHVQPETSFVSVIISPLSYLQGYISTYDGTGSVVDKFS